MTEAVFPEAIFCCHTTFQLSGHGCIMFHPLEVAERGCFQQSMCLSQ